MMMMPLSITIFRGIGNNKKYIEDYEKGISY